MARPVEGAAAGEQPQPPRGTAVLAGIRAHLHPTDDTHRVTTLELIFDLVFVYSLTNVTTLMEERVDATGFVQGVVLLALVWFGWCSYAWLGNQAKADEGLLRLTMVVAMGGMFFLAISIPGAFADEGNAAVVLVVACAVVRLAHNAVYLIAAGDDEQMRSVLMGMLGVILVTLALLFVGAFVGGRGQLWWWVAAVAVDQLGVYFVRSDKWILRSASHFAERFGLVVIIAIGESIVELGAAASTPELTLRTAVALVCGFAIAICLWWSYFDVVALVAERTLTEATGLRRTRLARDSYTYLHFPMVVGIVFTAFGLHLLVRGEHTTAGRVALYGGIALYLLAHLGFRLRNVGSINRPRAGVMVALVLAIPLTSGMGMVGQLAIPAGLMVALIGYEVYGLREWREAVRHGTR